jgi:hypothetical protein
LVEVVSHGWSFWKHTAAILSAWGI